MPRSWIAKSFALFSLAVALLVGVHSGAQVSTASITGIVQDTTGAVVPGATIVATQTETNYISRTVAGKTGEFSLSNLPIGPYKLLVSSKGFARLEQKGIVLTVGQVANMQLALQIGAESQEVVVTADVAAVEATESTIQNVVEEKEVTDLPLNGRNPAALMNTVAGVTDSTLNVSPSTTISMIKSADSGMASSSAPTTHGVRAGGTYFSLDGAGNVDPFSVISGPFPNPDATQEFSVVTGSYGARYVSAPGGAVNIVSRSGTNQFHGSAFEFIRNGYFNALNYYASGADVLKRNQFGFALGGPILKDHLFFFGSYQASPISNSAALLEATPTSAERAGTFTSAITGATVQIPGFFASKTTQNLLKYYPLPQADGYAHMQKPSRTNEPQAIAKLDWNLGAHRIFARYFGDHYHVDEQAMTNNNIFSTAAGADHNWDAIALGDTWASKSGSWIADSRASFAKANITNTFAGSSSVSLAALGATNLTASTQYPGLGVIVTNSVADSPGFNAFPRSTMDFSEDVMHTVGKHQLSLGADYRHIRYKEDNVAGQNGVAIFAGVASTIVFGPLNDNTTADFYMGAPLIWIQSDGFYVTAAGNMIGAYGEDKYRVNDRLTATVGLRWDPYLPFAPDKGRIDCWNPGSKSSVFTGAPKGLLYPGDSGCGSGGTDAKYLNQFQPRVGLAYRLDKKGNTALRAGYGMYSTQISLNSYMGFSAMPWVRTYTVVNPFQSLDNIWGSNSLSNPFAAGFQGLSYAPTSSVAYPTAAPGFQVGAMDKNFRPAYVQQYTLSLQQAIGAHDSIEAAYVGTAGVHIANSYDVNVPASSSTASTSNEFARRPYSSEGLAGIIEMRSDTTSNYNGLDLTFRHHGKGGIGLTSSFNWSKCMDEGSQPPTTNAATENGNDRKLRYGRCDFDQKADLRNTITWNSPSLKDANRIVRVVAGNWMASGLVVVDGGQPFSVTDSSDNSYTGLSLDLADRISGQPLYKNGKLNRAAFTDNAAGTYGNSGRNAYRAGKNVDTDMALMKAFKAGERLTTTFRAEAFNLFNHPNLLPPTSQYNTTTSATFGQSTAARDPRILQFSLKMQF